MDCEYIQFSGHAIQRMFERNINEKNVIQVLRSGKTIKEYPDDKPYPSFVMLGFPDSSPIHVVAAFDEQTKTCYIITVYYPEPQLWNFGYKKRLKV